MTEEEAKTKWCPFGRRYIFEDFTMGPAATAINEPDSIDYRQNCIASDCMMWVVDVKAGGGLKEDSGGCGLSRK